MSQVSSDPISDMLTRIRNAIAVNQDEISLPYSHLKEAVAQILAQSNFIDGVAHEGKDKDKLLILRLSQPGHNSPISSIAKVSKPGRRTYAKANDIPVVKRGRGIVIVSTSKGVMSGDAARQANIGGEIICEVY